MKTVKAQKLLSVASQKTELDRYLEVVKKTDKTEKLIELMEGIEQCERNTK